MKRMSVVFLLLLGSALAQFSGGMMVRQVRVQLDFVNGPCDTSTHVTLMGRSGPVAEGVANERCIVEFTNVPAGNYHLSVSGQGFSDTNAGSISASSTGPSDFDVKVKRPSDISRTDGAPANPFVSAADLAIPVRAQKEFDKANEWMARQDFTKAIERLNRAIAIYPAYASAYNNLGVIYAHLGDSAREHESLQKAISINDHFAPAYVNLGRMSIKANDFRDAETMLTKASSLDPTNAMTYVLLTYVEFRDQHLDEAIAASQKAHALQEPHAFVHQVAARALQQKGEAANAIAELELFLKEEPAGPRADNARKDLARLQSASQ